MDVQTEKLQLIERLVRLQDISIIEKVKEVLQGSEAEETIGYDSEGNIITKSDLISRAEASNKAIKQGRTKSIDQVRINMKSW